MKVALSSRERNLCDLEYSDGAVLLSKEASLNDSVGMFGMCFASSKCRMLN